MRLFTLFLSALFFMVSGFAFGADLYQANLSAWNTHVKDIEGREFKFLADPAKLPASPEEAFKTLWSDALTVAHSVGVVMIEREKKPFRLSPSIKTFYDTPSMNLWKKGYLIRLTTSYKDGEIEDPLRVTVKSINPSFQQALAAKLATKGVKGSVSAEENIGIGKNGQLAGYVEKGVSFSVNRDELQSMNLADFATYVPELGELGLPADTRLVAHVAFGVRCRPGFVQLPGIEKPVAVSMESWAKSLNEMPFVYDFSFGYDGPYDTMIETHKVAEKFTMSLYSALDAKIGFGTDSGKWNGSKARLFLNQGF